MEKKTFYRIIIFILIIFNIGSLGYIYWGGKKHLPHPHHRGPRDLIIEKLDFSPEQVKKYDLFIKIHQTNVRSLQLKKVELKNQLYSLLNEASIDTIRRDHLLSLIQENHDEIESIHFHHFEEIKSICIGKEQLAKYKKLSVDFSKFFAPPPMRK